MSSESCHDISGDFIALNEELSSNCDNKGLARYDTKLQYHYNIFESSEMYYDHLDQWGLPMFQGTPFDSVVDSPYRSKSQQETQNKRNEQLIEWEPSINKDPKVMENFSTTASTSTDAISTTSLPRKEKSFTEIRKESRKRKLAIQAKFDLLKWTTSMNVKVLTSHANLLDKQFNTRAVTDAFLKSLEMKGACKDYIYEFKRLRILHRHSKTRMKKSKISSLRQKSLAFKVAEDSGIYTDLKKSGTIDFINDSLLELEEKTRD